MKKKASLLLLILTFTVFLALPLNFIPIVKANPDQVTLKPNAAGDVTQMSVTGASANWNACWSDDGDTSYVSATSNKYDLYNFDNFPYPNPSVSSVVVYAKAKQAPGPSQFFNFKIKTSGTEYTSGETYLSQSYAEYSWDVIDKETTWTQEKLNNLQAGVRWTTSYSTEFRCTQVWVEVTFTVVAPTYHNVGTNSTRGGMPCEFQIKWNASSGNTLDWCGFVHNNTGTWSTQNETIWNDAGETTKWGNITKTLNSTVGQIVGFRWYCNDSSGNMTDSGIQTITVGSLPIASDVGCEVYLNPNYKSTIGQPIKFYAYWTDLVNLSGYIFGCNTTGNWVNQSWTSLAGLGTSAWTNKTPYNYARGVNRGAPLAVGTTIEFKIWCNNTESKWGTTGSNYVITTCPNVKEEMQWVFDQSVSRKLTGSNPPFVRGYDEYNALLSTRADAEDMLTGVHFYRFTLNQTYLNQAYETASWLNNTSNNPRDLFSYYDQTLSAFPNNQEISSTTVGRRLILLCNVVDLDASFMQLLKNVTNKAIEMFLPTNTCRVYTMVQRDGTIKENAAFVENTAVFSAALSWAYNLTGNETYRDCAVRMIMNWTYGNYSIPYESIYQNGTPRFVYWATTSARGDFVNQLLLAMNTIYYYTRNGTVKDYINRTAWYVAQAFWSGTHFVYRVDVNDGSILDNQYIHGEGITEEALFGASLIWGNTTWRDRVQKSFESYSISPDAGSGILERNLITHGSAAGHDVTWGWTVYARRMSFILFSYYDHNQTYRETSNKLYAASVIAHKKTKGYVSSIYADDITRLGDYRGDESLSSLFRGFANCTISNITDFNGYFEIFGEPFTGAGIKITGIHEVAVTGVKTFCPKESLDPVTEGYTTWTDIKVNVTLQNLGDFQETFTVTAHYENATGKYVIGTQTGVTLDSKANKTITITWNPTGVKTCVIYTVSANASRVLGDINATNNYLADGTVKIKHLGDASNDDLVDVDDLQILGWSWLKRVADPGYRAQADFSFDALTDVDDLQILGWNWLKP